MTRPLLILTPDHYPGMCNAYLAYANIKAFSLKLNAQPAILFPSETPDLSLSPMLRSRVWIKLARLLTLPIKVLSRIIPSFSPFFVTYYFNPESSCSLFETFIRHPAKIVILRGWGYSDNQLLDQYRAQILRQMHITQPKTYSDSTKLNKVPTLGVHVRRTDYKHFQGGRFYYSYSIYLHWIEHVRSLIGQVQIIFFSDDPTYVSKYLGGQGRLNNGSAKEDLALLSQCDFILGPPSTFSMWATFIGNKSAMHMYQSRPTSHDVFVPWQKLIAYNACA